MAVKPINNRSTPPELRTGPRQTPCGLIAKAAAVALFAFGFFFNLAAAHSVFYTPTRECRSFQSGFKNSELDWVELIKPQYCKPGHLPSDYPKDKLDQERVTVAYKGSTSRIEFIPQNKDRISVHINRELRMESQYRRDGL